MKMKITQLMSNMDIFPTIFDLIGIENKKRNIDGQSFKPIINNLEMKEKPIYLHTMPHENIEEDDAEGLRTRKYKFLRSTNNHTKNRHLYDLESDQFENKNIIQTLPEITKELEENLDHIKSSSTKESEDISEEETKKIQDELKRLGYM